MRPDHIMTLNDARAIGKDMLRISPDVFDRSMEQAQKMGVRPRDLGPMTLALALMGAAKAHLSDQGLEAELTDALEVVAKAEKEWLMQQKIGRMQ